MRRKNVRTFKFHEIFFNTLDDETMKKNKIMDVPWNNVGLYLRSYIHTVYLWLCSLPTTLIIYKTLFVCINLGKKALLNTNNIIYFYNYIRVYNFILLFLSF